MNKIYDSHHPQTHRLLLFPFLLWFQSLLSCLLLLQWSSGISDFKSIHWVVKDRTHLRIPKSLELAAYLQEASSYDFLQ